MGSLNHILTAHIEGGEVSGTIDDTIRHAVTKLSHVHFVGNNKAKRRVINMGEKRNSVFNIGSPDMDILLSNRLPSIKFVKKRYNIKYENYGILLWHPVTSTLKLLKEDTLKLVDFVNKFNQNFVIIHPNNDPGNNIILDIYKKKLISKKYKIFKSIRFEYFVTLLKYSKFIIGNSSAGIYEAPIFGVPTINVGNRQNKRLKTRQIKDIKVNDLNLSKIETFIKKYKKTNMKYYGTGNADKKFAKELRRNSFWKISRQKYFSDIKI